MDRAQRSRIRTKARAAGQTVRECMCDTACDRICKEGLPAGGIVKREHPAVVKMKAVSSILLPAIKSRVEKVAIGTNLHLGDLINLGLRRIFDEYDSTGEITMKASAPAKPARRTRRTPDALRQHCVTLDLSSLTDAEWKAFCDKSAAAGRTPDDQLRALALEHVVIEQPPVEVLPEHQEKLRWVGEMLETNPGTLLGWLLTDHLRDLLDANHGALVEWATRGIRYPREAAQRVRKRVLAWEKAQIGTNLKNGGTK